MGCGSTYIIPFTLFNMQCSMRESKLTPAMKELTENLTKDIKSSPPEYIVPLELECAKLTLSKVAV